MRLVNTKVHAVLDYLLGLTLLGAPWFFNYPPSGPKYIVPLIVGLVAAAMALVTRFEYSPFKIVPLKVHLLIDLLSGITLAVSPWLFGFHETVFKPHLVFGLTHAVVALITDHMLYDKVKDIKVRTDAEGNVLPGKINEKNKS